MHKEDVKVLSAMSSMMSLEKAGDIIDTVTYLLFSVIFENVAEQHVHSPTLWKPPRFLAPSFCPGVLR